MISTFSGYQLAVRDLPRSIEIVRSAPTVTRESEYYLENIQNVKSIEEFIKDDRLFRFAMKSHGLEEMTYAKALVRKVLDEGVDDQGAFVNRLTDQRYRKFAETFNFKSFGAATTSFSRVQDGVVDKYLRQELEESAGENNDGVRLALYFRRQAPGLTNVEQILAEGALSKVVRKVLQIPDATAFLSIDKQVEMLEERLDITDFSDPEKLENFINRFVNLWDVDNPTTSVPSQLFNGAPAFGVSSDLLLTIQLLK